MYIFKFDWRYQRVNKGVRNQRAKIWEKKETQGYVCDIWGYFLPGGPLMPEDITKALSRELLEVKMEPTKRRSIFHALGWDPRGIHPQNTNELETDQHCKGLPIISVLKLD